HPGKNRCLILDHSSTSSRLGLVTDISWGPLDDGEPNTSGKRRKEPVEPLECYEYHALMPQGKRVCAECGHEFKATSKVCVEDGELVEIRANGTLADKQAWYSQLLGLAEERGYKP